MKHVIEKCWVPEIETSAKALDALKRDALRDNRGNICRSDSERLRKINQVMRTRRIAE